MIDSNIQILLALLSVPGLGNAKIRTLLHAYPSLESIWEEDFENFLSLPGFTPKLIDALSFRRKQNLNISFDETLQLIPYYSPHYPKKLKEIPDHPLILYMRGEITCLERSIAIVGTRNCTYYGKEVAFQLAEGLAAIGFTIISGLARGIDTAAHLGALKRGRTAAVIGSGLAHIYPKENEGLAKKIAENGILLSEYSPTTPPHASNFPRRNRIVSGLSMGVVLIEAPEKSGAMLTMQNAHEQARPCFVIPGPVGNDFKGNHALIKTGKALLVESAEEIASHFDSLFSYSQTLIITPTFNFTWGEKEFYDKLPTEIICIDRIFSIVNLPVHQMQVMLMSLILKRALKELPGKMYKKVVVN